jgi:hypothetical protein
MSEFSAKEREYLRTQSQRESFDSFGIINPDTEDNVYSWYDDNVPQYMDMANNDNQRVMLGRMISQSREGGINLMYRHVAQQRKTAIAETLDADMLRTQHEAQTFADDPTKLLELINDRREFLQQVMPGHDHSVSNELEAGQIITIAAMELSTTGRYSDAEKYLEMFKDKLGVEGYAKAKQIIDKLGHEDQLEQAYRGALESSRGNYDVASKWIMNFNNFPELDISDRRMISSWLKADRSRMAAGNGASIKAAKDAEEWDIKMKLRSGQLTLDDIKLAKHLTMDEKLKYVDAMDKSYSNMVKDVKAAEKSKTIAVLSIKKNDGTLTTDDVLGSAKHLTPTEIGTWLDKADAVAKDKGDSGGGAKFNFFTLEKDKFAQSIGFDPKNPKEEQVKQLTEWAQVMDTAMKAKQLTPYDPSVSDLAAEMSQKTGIKPGSGIFGTSWFADEKYMFEDIAAGAPWQKVIDDNSPPRRVEASQEEMDAARRILEYENSRRIKQGKPRIPITDANISSIIIKMRGAKAK